MACPRTGELLFRAFNSDMALIHPQMPPPSLREVLGAYNLKGDGDRDMLIAMLNAKSAEDQVSALQVLIASPELMIVLAYGVCSSITQNTFRNTHAACVAPA
jgi:hypothetical protein